MNSRAHRTWVFTINNPTEDDEKWCLAQSVQATRMAASEEKGERGTTHIQGEIAFGAAKRFAAVKKLHARAHWEPKVSADWSYALKDGSRVIVNVNNSKQGKRTDLDAFQQDCKDAAEGKKSFNQVYEDNFKVFMKYRASAKAALSHYRQLRAINVRYPADSFNAEKPSSTILKKKTVIVLGASGTGKTQWVKTWFANPLFVSHMDDLGNLQEGHHDGIIFDDVSVTHMPRNAQIHLCDNAERRSIHIRYVTAEIPADLPRVFTCNNDPVDLADPAIKRRCHVMRIRGRLFNAIDEDEEEDE